MNADSFVNANGDIIGFNMFAYCSNNPIMGYDPSGNGWIKDRLNDVANFFSNTFGVGVVQERKYKSIKLDTLLFGAESGISSQK